MKLAAADQHRADLGQLALLARSPIGLGVDHEELRACERLGVGIHRRTHTRRLGWRDDRVAAGLGRPRCVALRLLV